MFTAGHSEPSITRERIAAFRCKGAPCRKYCVKNSVSGVTAGREGAQSCLRMAASRVREGVRQQGPALRPREMAQPRCDWTLNEQYGVYRRRSRTTRPVLREPPYGCAGISAAGEGSDWKWKTAEGQLCLLPASRESGSM